MCLSAHLFSACCCLHCLSPWQFNWSSFSARFTARAGVHLLQELQVYSFFTFKGSSSAPSVPLHQCWGGIKVVLTQKEPLFPFKWLCCLLTIILLPMWKSHDPPKANKSAVLLSSVLFPVLAVAQSELRPIPACLDLQMPLALKHLQRRRCWIQSPAPSSLLSLNVWLEHILPDPPFYLVIPQVLWSLPYSLQSYFRPTHLPGGGNAKSVFANKKSTFSWQCDWQEERRKHLALGGCVLKRARTSAHDGVITESSARTLKMYIYIDRSQQASGY